MSGEALAAVRRARWELRFRASASRAYLPLARARYGDAVVNRESELVIDGFTRTAVTFCVIGFQLAQRRPVRLAHTLHASAHLAEGVRLGVPCLVAVRQPDQTALSIVIREPYVTPRQALAAYARFYGQVATLGDDVVVADFGEVTKEFGGVIDRLNARFATTFDPFEHSAGNVEEVFGIIEDRSRHPAWSRALGAFEDGKIGIDDYRRAKAQSLRDGRAPGMGVPEHRVQRPSTVREQQKETLRSRLEAPSIRPERARAWDAYRALTSSP